MVVPTGVPVPAILRVRVVTIVRLGTLAAVGLASLSAMGLAALSVVRVGSVAALASLAGGIVIVSAVVTITLGSPVAYKSNMLCQTGVKQVSNVLC